MCVVFVPIQAAAPPSPACITAESDVQPWGKLISYCLNLLFNLSSTSLVQWQPPRLLLSHRTSPPCTLLSTTPLLLSSSGSRHFNPSPPLLFTGGLTWLRTSNWLQSPLFLESRLTLFALALMKICRLSGDSSRKVKHQSGKRVLSAGAHLRFFFPPRRIQADWIFWCAFRSACRRYEQLHTWTADESPI